jgi:hypothetical protein
LSGRGHLVVAPLYVEINAAGNARHLHYAPYLDYRPLVEDEPGVDALLARPECAWIGRELEHKAQGHAVAKVVPEHLDEVSNSSCRSRRASPMPASTPAKPASVPTPCRRVWRSAWRN